MSTLTIPATIEAMKSQLGGIDKLLHAKEWERAAIVAAYVRLSSFGENQYTEGVRFDTLSPNQFAKLGIAGMRSKNSVAYVVKRWLSLGVGYPTPGQTVELPDKPWKQEALDPEDKPVVAAVSIPARPESGQSMVLDEPNAPDWNAAANAEHDKYEERAMKAAEARDAALNATGTLFAKARIVKIKAAIREQVRYNDFDGIREVIAYAESALAADAAAELTPEMFQ